MNHKEHEEHKDQLERYAPLPTSTERVVREVIGAGLSVHRALGPGFLETVYEQAIALELTLRDLSFQMQKPVAIHYRGHCICSHRLDMVVEDAVVVEVKAVRSIKRIHQAQVLSYLKASGCRVGLLMNFNVRLFVSGLQRFVR